ncbi:unnamed protein product [Arctogadus glacialis]
MDQDEEIDLVIKTPQVFLLQRFYLFTHVHMFIPHNTVGLHIFVDPPAHKWNVISLSKLNINQRLLGADNLEAFMLMACEEGILMKQDSDHVVDRFAEKSIW